MTLSKRRRIKAVGPRVYGGVRATIKRLAGLVLATVLISTAHGADEGMAVNLGPQSVSETWNLGEHRARLELNLTRTARIWLADDRVWISLNAASPDLTTQLQRAFRSTAKSGYTVIARSGSTELSLGSIRGISISSDVHQAVWVRALVRVQQRVAGVTTTGEKRFTARLEPSVLGHALVFTVKALEIEGANAAVHRALAQQIPPLRLDLPECAQGLHFEKIRFAEKENAVTVTASVSGSNLFSILPCLTGWE